MAMFRMERGMKCKGNGYSPYPTHVHIAGSPCFVNYRERLRRTRDPGERLPRDHHGEGHRRVSVRYTDEIGSGCYATPVKIEPGASPGVARVSSPTGPICRARPRPSARRLPSPIAGISAGRWPPSRFPTEIQGPSATWHPDRWIARAYSRGKPRRWNRCAPSCGDWRYPERIPASSLHRRHQKTPVHAKMWPERCRFLRGFTRARDPQARPSAYVCTCQRPESREPDV